MVVAGFFSSTVESFASNASIFWRRSWGSFSIDTVWGGIHTPFDASSLAALSEYSDGASNATPAGPIMGYGCVPNVGMDVNLPFALRAANTTVSPNPDGSVNDLKNPFRASVEVTSSGGVPWSLTGVSGGTDGQIL